MGNLVNIQAGGPLAGLTGDSVPPYVTGRSYGPSLVNQGTAIGLVLSTTETTLIPYYVRTAVSFDGFAVQVSASQTNDMDLAVYDYITTSADTMGTQLAVANVTASFTVDTFTEIAFSGGTTAFAEGWVYLAVSGVSAGAGPTIYAAQATLVDNLHYLMPHGAFDAAGGVAGYFGDKAKFITTVQIDSITPGSTTFATDQTGTSNDVPFVQLRVG